MSNYQKEYIEQMAGVFGALSNPNRLQIYLRLLECCYPGKKFEGDPASCACVSDLSEGLNLAPSTVSHHVKELRQAGLIRSERNGQTVECWIDPNVVNDVIALLNQQCQKK